MAVNIPGLVAVLLFYIVILGIGIWASRKSKEVEKTCAGKKSEVTIVGGRNINTVVGLFTLTGSPFSVISNVCQFIRRCAPLPLPFFHCVLLSSRFLCFSFSNMGWWRLHHGNR